MKNKNALSNAYQFLFFEIPMDYEILCNFNNSNALYDSSQEQIIELREQLLRRVLILAPQILTNKQHEVFKMYFMEGLTTTAIAKQLKLNQSTVQQRLYGFKQDKQDKRGAIPQLRKALHKDSEISELLSKITEVMDY